MKTFRPKAVIFDFDGVLINSQSIHKKAWKDAYDSLFMEPFPNIDPGSLSGRSSDTIAENIVEAGGHPSEGHKLLRLKNHILNQMQTPPLVEGSREIVNHLKRNDIPIAICSNAQSYFIEQVTINNGFSFPVIIGFDNAPKPKPAPDGYIHAAKLLGVPEEEFDRVIVFEDSSTGIAAAVAAKMYPFGIEYQHSSDELLALGAEETSPDLATLWRDKKFLDFLP